MLSATPHDGRARSFASLMNMLDPTAIADPDNYGPEDIKGLCIRRFKKDIQEQVQSAFKKRQIATVDCEASAAEEQAYNALTQLEFSRIDKKRSGNQLFKTTLEKSLFSSPAACLQSIQNRIKRLESEDSDEARKDIDSLSDFCALVEKISVDEFSKFQRLVQVIRDKKHGLAWTGNDKLDRLVIFTERIETLKFLQENLPPALKLNEKHVAILHGSMSDVDQQGVVEEFGKEQSPVRLLIASDVASEGINLHYLSHRLIHFDIPWSLMVFQQRNGRIDRYGQESTPHILYLASKSKNEKIKGDMRILELLIKKDEEAVKNIGDPSALMGVFNIDEEELITARAIEESDDETAFEKRIAALNSDTFNPIDLLLQAAQSSGMDTGGENLGSDAEDTVGALPTLFPDDYSYLKKAVYHLRESQTLQADFNDEDRQVVLTAPEDLKRRLRFVLPGEVWPKDGTFILSDQVTQIQKEISQSRKQESTWPAVQYLWSQNPVVEWINNKVVAGFGRHEAPVLSLPSILNDDENVFILSGLIPNLKGHSLVHNWFAITFSGSTFSKIESFEDFLTRTGFGSKPNPNAGNRESYPDLQALLPKVVEQARGYMSQMRKDFEDRINPKLEKHLTALDTLRARQMEHVEGQYEKKRNSEKKDQQVRAIHRLFDNFIEWVEDTMTTEDKPYIQVVAVLKGGE